MRILVLALLFCSDLVLAGTGFMNKIRVFTKPDGQVVILRVVSKACTKSETPDLCFQRIALSDCPMADGKCLPFYDMFEVNLPSRKSRDKWRWDSTKKEIFIDNAIITKKEVVDAKWAIIKSTSTTKDEKLNALIEMEKIRRGEE